MQNVKTVRVDHSGHWQLSLAFVVLLWSQPWMASADTVDGTWFLAIDNDTFAQSDDHYTNGLQLGWVSGYLQTYNEGPVPDIVARALQHLPAINRQGRQRFISHSLSHRIFTPNDTEAVAPITNDVPYSGLLFASLTAGAQDAEQMDAFTFYYGIAGPSARGEEVQNEFHRLIGADQVNGWDNQIHDEILLNAAYEYRRRLWRFGQSNGWGATLSAKLAAPSAT